MVSELLKSILSSILYWGLNLLRRALDIPFSFKFFLLLLTLFANESIEVGTHSEPGEKESKLRDLKKLLDTRLGVVVHWISQQFKLDYLYSLITLILINIPELFQAIHKSIALLSIKTDASKF